MADEQFEIPEDVTTVDLAAARKAAEKRANALMKITDPSDEQLDELDRLADHLDALTAEGDRRQGEVQARQERRDAAARRIAGEPVDSEQPAEEADADEDADPHAEDGAADDGEDLAEADEEEQPVVETRQPIAAGAVVRRTKSVAGRMRTKDRRPVDRTNSGGLTITAAGSARGVQSGSELDFDGLVRTFQATQKGHPRDLVPDMYLRDSVAVMSRGDQSFRRGDTVLSDAVGEFSNDDGMLRLLDEAGNERNLAKGNLAASGGWCAPSETLYDIPSLETNGGEVDLPEIRVTRGGIRFTQGPDFSDIYTNSGFWQTEAQAISGTSKRCYEVSCPSFTEVRLDAAGFCFKSPILTATAYPELVRRVLAGGLVAHRQKISNNTITAMSNALTVTGTVVDSGSTQRDLLTSLELAAEGQRAAFHMALDATMEVVLPHWAKLALRDDMQTRTRQIDPVTDAQIQAHFAARNLNVQFVYGLNDSAVAVSTVVLTFPATLTALMYPAGTFVRGREDIISLDTVYDSTDLQVNIYTAAFFEEGILVAKRLPTGVKLTIPVKPSGRVGLADLDMPYGTAQAPVLGQALTSTT